MLRYLLNQDGSLRDIYIKNVSKTEWRLFLQFLHDYACDFFIDDKQVSYRLNFDQILDLSSSKTVLLVINLSQRANVFCHFFLTKENYSEIELDFDPKAISDQDEMNTLLCFLKKLSLFLKRDVFICNENAPEEVLYTVCTDSLN